MTPSPSRLLIISPVRDEAAHIERVADALAAQTRPPDRWIVVDDGSSDGTPEILTRLSNELGFMDVVATPPDFTLETADRLAVAADARAFNHGLGAVEVSEFTHIGKLDGDVELRPDYYEAILGEFARNPELGIGGGTILERHQGTWQPIACAPKHVRGAFKVYAMSCFEAIGGIEERLGWDGIDEVAARMRGFQTRSFDQVEALHHRHAGSADGRLRGHARWGETHWILYHGVAWTVLRAFKVARRKPRGLSGAAYLYGYASAATRRVPRVQIDGYRCFVRAEQRQRMVERMPLASLIADRNGRKKGRPAGVRP